MKTLVFSDTHLGRKFSKKKFDFLADLFRQFDQIIINGDFWDQKKITFDEFMVSDWSNLFGILKSKKAVYIHGNHDPAEKTDDRVKEFCDLECHFYRLELPDGRVLHIEHGQNLSFLSRVAGKLFRRAPKYLAHLTFFFNFPFKYLQIALMYSGKKGMKITNKAMNYGFIRKSRKKDYILVMGHTHGVYIDLDSGFINTGFIDKNFASYLDVTGPDLALVRNYY